MQNTFGILRALRQEEIELILSWRNAPEVRANMYTNHEITLEEHLAWWGNVSKSESHQYFMYEFEGRPLGVVGFTGINHRQENATWAFYSSPKAPKGTGSKMEFLALDYAFDRLDLHKLHCEVLAFNNSVIKLHEKFGFKVEGILREHYKAADGCFVNIYVLGLLAHEWVERRGKMKEKLNKIVKG